MDHSRLRIATRIHYLLARYLGDGINVGTMLERADYAREVLFVCDASDDPELQALARQFRDALAIDPSLALQPLSNAPVAAARAPAQDAGWVQDSSGFGVARLAPRPPTSRRGARWYDPSSWFGGLQA